MGPLPRRLVAEFVGTIFLVLFGAGAVVTALQAGNGTLAYGGLGFVALSLGLAIAVAIYAFGTTSGAHLNPAVTVSLAAVRRFGWAASRADHAARAVVSGPDPTSGLGLRRAAEPPFGLGRTPPIWYH